AIKNANKILEKNPDARVFVLFRDMMTYGFTEQYYTKARGDGVLFINYELDSKPKVEVVDGEPKIKFMDPVLEMPFKASPDLLVLSTGIEAEASNKDLAKVFGLTVDKDGFFQEADSKWRPVEFMRPGIYLAGLSHSPQPINEAFVQAEAAAHKAYSYLSRAEIHTPRVVAKVHDALCSRCQLCIDACPFEARTFDDMNNCIVIEGAACQACGACAVVCRNNAAEVLGWNEKQTMAIIDAKLRCGHTSTMAD
ncbi:MAG: 4Fe-4S binding protein, partial [Proteobacteria bacterium]|nr:4Fe-4S binding protein [Pseudomonadota bacterium]